MGLISALLTLPVAPVRGVAWLAEQIESEARRQWSDPDEVRRQMSSVEQAFADGLLSEAERDQRLDALVARLVPGSGAGPGAGDG